MIVNKDQNVPENGYGPPDAANYRPSLMLQAWAKLYGVENFPLYSAVLEQAESSQSRFHRLRYSNDFLDRQVRNGVTLCHHSPPSLDSPLVQLVILTDFVVHCSPKTTSMPYPI